MPPIIPVHMGSRIEGGSAVNKTFRYGKVWPLTMVLAGFIIWLAQGILAQGQVDRKPVVIERAPLRFIKDPNPSFSAVPVDSDSTLLVLAHGTMFRILHPAPRDSPPPPP